MGHPAMKPVSWVEAWRSEAAGMGTVPRPVLGPEDSLGLVAEKLNAATVLGKGGGTSREGESDDRERTGSVASQGKTDIRCAPVVACRLQVGLSLTAALPKRAEPLFTKETGVSRAYVSLCTSLPDTAAPKNVQGYPVPPGE